nr:unnamed protein product [Digitaria exilis]
MAKLVKILCKGGNNLYVSIRGDEFVLAHDDPKDKTQQWFMDYSRASNVTDDNGQTVFALVNKVTRQAMVNKEKQRDDVFLFDMDLIIKPYIFREQVQLASYVDDERVPISVLWTVLEEEHGDGFHPIATLRDSSEVLGWLKGNVKEGPILGVQPFELGSDNQLWKFLPV